MFSNSDTTEVANSAAEVTQLRVIPDGEKFSTVTKYNGDKTVTAVYAFRFSKDGERYEKASLFDFSNVSEEQLYQLAMYGAKVAIQSQLRGMSKSVALDPATLQRVDVLKDIVQATRAPTDPKTAFIKAAAKLGITEATAMQMVASQAQLDEAAESQSQDE